MKFRVVRGSKGSVFRVEYKRFWFDIIWIVHSNHDNHNDALTQVKYLKELVSKGIIL